VDCFWRSITLSVLILMTSLFIRAPLGLLVPDHSAELDHAAASLNLASTRLILSRPRGHRGRRPRHRGHRQFDGRQLVIPASCSRLVIVNFVSHHQGFGPHRRSRRTLVDSMPGKQMAIDADLSAGLIDERLQRGARSWRTKAASSAPLDGASGIRRGDAVVGLLVASTSSAASSLALQRAGFGERRAPIPCDGRRRPRHTVPALIVSTARAFWCEAGVPAPPTNA
jgi:flagellar biosynthesis protein FlhA